MLAFSDQFARSTSSRRAFSLLVLACLCCGCTRPSDNENSPSKALPNRANESVADNLSDSDLYATSIRFEDFTAESGVNAVYQTGREAGHYAILESLGGGVGMVDFDLDGANDLFFPQGGGFDGTTILAVPSLLYRNLGDARFTDASDQAQLVAPDHYTHGCSVDDFDGDGFADILVTGYGGLQLFRNMGDGTFVEQHEKAGLLDNEWSTSAAWGDINGDSFPDLYVAHYCDWSFENHPSCPAPFADIANDVCPPRAFSDVADVLYVSNGDGTFRNATSESGLRSDGKGLSVVITDVDLDGDNDIYVANDMVDNFFYENDGSGRFEEVGLLSGTATDLEGFPNGSMGIAVFDYNEDLKPDLWVTNYEGETFALYRNDGEGNFLHASREASISSLGGRFVGFGTVVSDFDCDGDQDVVVANGHVVYHPRHDNERQEQLLLESIGKGQFKRSSPSSDGYFQQQRIGRGIAVGDLDGDNLADLVFTHNDEPAVVLLNRSVDHSTRNIRVRLVGRESSRQPVGAELVFDLGSNKRLRQTVGGGSYLSQSADSCSIGRRGDETSGSINIRWPSGRQQTVDLVEGATALTIVEQ